jgi:very-short-patch-repair endonuclease
MSHLEEEFAVRWAKLYPSTPLERGRVGSLKIIGVDSTRSQVDFYCPKARVILEINGATHKGRAGAHSSGPGLRRDFTKQLLAQSQDWLYFELDSLMVKDKLVLNTIHKTLLWRMQGKGDNQVVIWEQWKHLMPKSKTKVKSKVKSTFEEYID